jgi:hypothetical protein
MQRIGVFKARSGNNVSKERIIHAPDGTEGEFVLYRKIDGTLVYQPVHP